MPYLTLADLDLRDRVVLYRGPFNLPLNEDGTVVNDYRARMAMPSLEFILQQNPRKLLLVTHVGRPKGKVVEMLKTDPIGKWIQQLLQEQGYVETVHKVGAVFGPEIDAAVAASDPRKIIMLENVRFWPGEQVCDPIFSRQLAGSADVFIYDAPNDMHRAHSSTYGLTQFLPSAAGFLIDREIDTLKRLLDPPPGSILVLGGAKVRGKYETIEGLIEKYEYVILGGKMANTFLKAKGYSVGASETEDVYLDRIRDLFRRYGEKILLPVDVVTADRQFGNRKVVNLHAGNEVERDHLIFDTGHTTNVRNQAVIDRATGYIVWNGPFGVFENGFTAGTYRIAQSMSRAYGRAKTIVLGGDTQSAAEALDGFVLDIVLTGGGASLEFLERRGTRMPALQGLEESYQRLQRGEYDPKAIELLKPHIREVLFKPR